MSYAVTNLATRTYHPMLKSSHSVRPISIMYYYLAVLAQTYKKFLRCWSIRVNKKQI